MNNLPDTTTITTTLVVGGSGKTGRRVLDRLAERGLPTVSGSRSGERRFDWDDRATWERALAGVSALYISYFPDLAVPGAADKVGALAELAARQGVKRLVLLSGRGEEEAQHAEQVVQAAFPAATIVRCSWFAQNFSEGQFIDGILAGELALPVGDVGEPFVDAGDIADVAVAALTEDGHEGQLYELTGPRLLRFDEAVEEIAQAVGRPIRFVAVPAEDFEAQMRAEEVPDDVLWLVSYLFTEVLDGRNAHLTDGVQRALGRPPRDFADYARDVAATGVWEPAS